MRSLNRVMLIGHLAAEVELRQTKNGHDVANFPVATNRISYDDNGEKQEIADFHRIVAWKKLGEICAKYLVKGTAVFVEGRLMNRSFEDKDGNRHYRTEIIADGLNILTYKKSKSGKQEVGIESIPGSEEASRLTKEEKELVVA